MNNRNITQKYDVSMVKIHLEVKIRLGYGFLNKKCDYFSLCFKPMF